MFHGSGAKKGCSRTTSRSGSTGRSWRPTGRSAQSAARWTWKTSRTPTDRAKKGAKRSVLTDAAGVPMGLAHEGANRHDVKLFYDTIASTPIARPVPTDDQPQGLCLDRGYDYDSTRESVIAQRFRGAHPRPRRGHQQAKAGSGGSPTGSPGARVVEACRSSINRNREPADPLVKEGGGPPRATAARRRPDRLQESPRPQTIATAR